MFKTWGLYNAIYEIFLICMAPTNNCNAMYKLFIWKFKVILLCPPLIKKDKWNVLDTFIEFEIFQHLFYVEERAPDTFHWLHKKFRQCSRAFSKFLRNFSSYITVYVKDIFWQCYLYTILYCIYLFMYITYSSLFISF